MARRWGSAAYLTVLVLALSGICILWISHEVRAQAAAQARAGQLAEHKICSTLGGLAALRPPAGNPVTNPSRAYLQGLHAKFEALGTDLGCGGPR
jgi:hypothetical protein